MELLNKKLTLKEKIAIFEKAIEIIPTSDYGFCYALKHAIINVCGLYVDLNYFPEFEKYFPEITKYRPTIYGAYWWKVDSEGKQRRISILKDEILILEEKLNKQTMKLKIIIYSLALSSLLYDIRHRYRGVYGFCHYITEAAYVVKFESGVQSDYPAFQTSQFYPYVNIETIKYYPEIYKYKPNKNYNTFFWFNTYKLLGGVRRAAILAKEIIILKVKLFNL